MCGKMGGNEKNGRARASFVFVFDNGVVYTVTVVPAE